MKILVAAVTLLAASCCAAHAQSGAPPGGAIEHVGPLSSPGEAAKRPLVQAPELTAAQKDAILRSVTRDKPVAETSEFLDVVVGELVPPAVESHPLPAAALGQAPTARPYRYALIADQVVLIDPTTMRVVDMINR